MAILQPSALVSDVLRNSNLGFIHIYSHSPILHIILPLMSLLIRSAITAKSSAYNSSHGDNPEFLALDMSYIRITNNNRINAEPWCIQTFTSKHLLLKLH